MQYAAANVHGITVRVLQPLWLRDGQVLGLGIGGRRAPKDEWAGEVRVPLVLERRRLVGFGDGQPMPDDVVVIPESMRVGLVVENKDTMLTIMRLHPSTPADDEYDAARR